MSPQFGQRRGQRPQLDGKVVGDVLML